MSAADRHIAHRRSRPVRRFSFALIAGAAASLAFSAEPPAGGAFAWTARKGEALVHLVGTVHAGIAGNLDRWPAELEWCWQRTDGLLVEADTEDAAVISELIRKYGIASSADDTWGDRWTKELRDRVRRVVGDLPLEADRMRPWLLMQTVAVAHLVQQGLQPQQGLDARLIRRARAEGRAITELEGAERQLRIFADAPLDLQMAMLTDVLDDIESGEAAREVRRIMEACEQSNIEALEQLYSELAARRRPADRYLFRRLFEERHPAMLDAIERNATGEVRPLVAVGALHFVGPDGLLAGLRRRGWTVERVTMPAPTRVP